MADDNDQWVFLIWRVNYKFFLYDLTHAFGNINIAVIFFW